jgi:transposase, IS30 family
MKKTTRRAAGRQPMVDKQREFTRLIRQGVSNSEACRRLGIDRKTGHWWKNGGQVTRNGVTRVVMPVIHRHPASPSSPRYLSEDERVVIADGVRAGRSARSIAAELDRSSSTVAREITRNRDPVTGEYRPHAAHQQMLARRPRPKQRRLALEHDLRSLVQGYLDKHWSPEQIARQLRVEHDVAIAVETIYQALYSPAQVLQRDPRVALRTKRPYRRPRRRGEARRSRFIAPVRLITERPTEADDRTVAGHWEGDLIVGAYNRSAIGTLVERTTRYTLLVHLDGRSRAEALRDGLIAPFNDLPEQLRRSLSWDQGSEIAHHHRVAQATGMPVFLCHAGRPWERPSNENTNGLLRDYFPKGTDLRLHAPDRLRYVAEELNQRPRKTLDWRTPEQLFTTVLRTAV